MPLNLFQGSFEDRPIFIIRIALSSDEKVSSDLRVKVHQKVHQLRCLTNILWSILIKNLERINIIYDLLFHNFSNKIIIVTNLKTLEETNKFWILNFINSQKSISFLSIFSKLSQAFLKLSKIRYPSVYRVYFNTTHDPRNSLLLKFTSRRNHLSRVHNVFANLKENYSRCWGWLSPWCARVTA